MLDAYDFKKRATLRAVFRFLSLVAVGLVACWAQSSSGSLSGTVVDGSGAGISDANVRLTDIGKGVSLTTRTNSAGQFTFPDLPASAYSLAATKVGFATAEIRRVVVNASERNTLRIPLEVAPRQDAVSVIADTQAIRESPSVATVITEQFIRNQPLNGRSFQSLVELSPGVSLTPSNLVTPGQFSVNGQRATSNYFTVDGVSANFGASASVTPYEAGGSVPSYSAIGSTNSLASLDAVQEFSIQTSTYAPEYGRQPGAQVAVVTRSGTNTFHGSAFDYLRNDKLDANNFFANANGLPRRPEKQNDFGFVLGGPLTLPSVYSGRDRTFFFVSYEGVRLRTPFVTDPLQVPSVEARQNASGDLKNILNAFPLPTGAPSTATPGSAPYVGSFSNPASLNATSVRIDHRFSDRVSLFGRLNQAPSENLERAKFCAASCVSATTARTQTFTIGMPWVVTPRLTNDLRFNYSRARTNLSYFLDNFGGAVVPPASSLYPSFTSGDKGYIYIEVDPSGNNTISDGLFVNNEVRQTNVVETLHYVHGSHNLQAGFDYRRLAAVSDSGSYRRQFLYPSVQTLTGGIAPIAALFAPSAVLQPIYGNYSSYIQDVWRIRPGMTLTWGVRHEVAPAPSEANGNLPATLLGLEDPSTFRLAPAGTKFYPTTWNNFGPRAGFSWQPWTDRQFVIRTGAGVFHDLGYGFTGVAFSTSLYPYGRSLSIANVPYNGAGTDAQPPSVSANPPYPRVFAYETDYKLPYSVQWSLAVEQGLSADDKLTLSYVGASGHNLARVESLRGLNPNFTRIDAVRNAATSDYNSLQVQYSRRLRRGLQALTSYTFGKSLDTASEESLNNFQAPATRLDPAVDRGPSSFDVRHTLNTAVSYEFFGFGVDGIFRTRTATPVNVLTDRDAFGLGFRTVSRPDLVAGVPLYLESDGVPGGRRINPDAFNRDTPVAAGRQGTLGRNVLRGFNLAQLDLSLRRQFPITERVNLQFRVDGFNVLNHANFANPGGVLGSSTFGRATQMLGSGLAGLNPLFQVGGPRSVQLALKLQF